MPITGAWYITMKAVEDYLRLTGRDPDPDDETWDAAEDELLELTKEAHFVKPMRSGAELWRGKRPLRLSFVVTVAPTPDGDAPQLVSVLGESARSTRVAAPARRVTVWDGQRERVLDVARMVLDPGPERRIAYKLASGGWLNGYRGKTRPDHVEGLRETVSAPEWALRLAGKSSRRSR